MRIVHLEPNRILLNHSFQGYKLAETAQSNSTHHTIDLPQAALSQCRFLDDSSELQVLALRMHWNALYRLSDHEVIFFDHEQRLWRVELGEEEICELLEESVPLRGQGEAKFPSACLLNEQFVLLLRSPYEHLELIDREEENPRARVIYYKLPVEIREQPFLYIGSVQPGASPPSSFTVVLVSLEGSSGRGRRSTFVCHWLRVSNGQTTLISQFQSQSRPAIVKLCASGDLLLGSSTSFEPRPHAPASKDNAISAEDESRTGGDQDVKIQSLKYSWEQDEENLYITIPLDLEVQPQVSIAQTEVRVSAGGDEDTSEEKVILLECPYGEINPGESSWTTSETQYLLITLRKGLRSSYSWPTLWRAHVKGMEEGSVSKCINREGDGIDDDESDRRIQDSLDKIIITLYQPQSRGSSPAPLWRSGQFRYLGPFLDPRSEREASFSTIGVVTTHGDDALAFSIDAGTGHSQHCHSYDAMAFVLGGKTSRRYALFTPTHALIIESRHHVFIYDATRSAGKKNPTQRYQTLTSLPDHDAPIIGWALLGGGQTLLLLTPQQLHIAHLS